ncbi:MAG: PilN domain-containing protein [Fimbriimonas sp.]
MSKTAPDVSLVLEWSPRGVVAFEPGHKSTRAFETVAEAVANSSSKTALVAVSRRSVFVRTLYVPNAAPSEIEIIVQMKLGELFPLPANELAYSIDLTDQVTPEGRLAVVVAMPAVDLRKLHEEMRAAGVRVQRVVPVAYGSLALADSLGLKDTAVVSREEAGLGIDIVSNGVLRYSRVAGTTANASAEVCRTYTVAGIPCGDILATEGVVVDDADRISTIAPLEALAGVWPTKVPTLELPEAVALKVSRATAARRRMAAFLMLAGIVLAVFAYFDYDDSVKLVQKAEARWTTQVRRAELDRKEAEKAAETSAAMEAAMRLATEPGQNQSDIVAAAANAAPEGIWLTGITLERGKVLLLRGSARTNDDITEYLRRLTLLTATVSGNEGISVAPRFRDVTLAFSNTGKIDDVPILQFSISAFPVGNLPLVDTTKKKVAPKK